MLGASRNVSLNDDKHISLKVLKIYRQGFFLFWKSVIEYWTMHVAAIILISFIQTFTTRWTIILALFFNMKQILIFLKTVFVELICLSADLKIAKHGDFCLIWNFTQVLNGSKNFVCLCLCSFSSSVAILAVCSYRVDGYVFCESPYSFFYL